MLAWSSKVAVKKAWCRTSTQCQTLSPLPSLSLSCLLHDEGQRRESLGSRLAERHAPSSQWRFGLVTCSSTMWSKNRLRDKSTKRLLLLEINDQVNQKMNCISVTCSFDILSIPLTCSTYLIMVTKKSFFSWLWKAGLSKLNHEKNLHYPKTQCKIWWLLSPGFEMTLPLQEILKSWKMTQPQWPSTVKCLVEDYFYSFLYL